MARVNRIKRVHPDCPFTKEQIEHFQSMLYNVASANNITAYPSWYIGHTNHQNRQADHKEAYKKWLEKELKKITTPSNG